MSEFSCPIVKVTKTESHPDADRLSIIYFNGFGVVSAKLEDGSHRYSVGELVVYCPQDAIIPDYLLKRGFFKYDVAFDIEGVDIIDFSKNPVTNHPETPKSLPDTPGATLTVDGVTFTVLETGKGMLGGKDGNVVKPIKLRGYVSQGIMFPVDKDTQSITNDSDPENPIAQFVFEGDDVAEFLGIKKFEPVLPTSMSGDMIYLGTNVIPHFDVENVRKYPNILNPEEEVIVTEKLHGTFFGVGYVPGLNNPDVWDGDFFCYSKGLGNKGLVFKNTQTNATNLYVKTFLKILPILQETAQRTKDSGINTSPKFFMGEIFGKGVQDLDYGTKEADFRLFDAYSSGSYCDWNEVVVTAKKFNVQTVPILFKGLLKEYNTELKTGNSTLAKHVREGVVIKPTVTRMDKHIGRIILKDVNEKYLTRKGGTEFN